MTFKLLHYEPLLHYYRELLYVEKWWAVGDSGCLRGRDEKKLGRAPAVRSLEPVHSESWNIYIEEWSLHLRLRTLYHAMKGRERSTTMSTHNTHTSPQNLANKNNVLYRLANLRVDRQLTNILMLQFILITYII